MSFTQKWLVVRFSFNILPAVVILFLLCSLVGCYWTFNLYLPESIKDLEMLAGHLRTLTQGRNINLQNKWRLLLNLAVLLQLTTEKQTLKGKNIKKKVTLFPSLMW